MIKKMSSFLIYSAFFMRALFMSSLLMVSSCGNGNGTNESTLFPVEKKSPLKQSEIVTYDKIKSEILEPKGCLNCHSDDGYGSEKGLLSAKDPKGDLIITPGDYDRSIFFHWVDSGKMPKKPQTKLSDAQLALIKNYITNLTLSKFPQTEPTPSPAPTESPEFTYFKKKILEEIFCLKCHLKDGWDDEKKLLNFKDKNGELIIKVNDTKNSLFYKRVENGTMPKEEEKLNAEKRGIIEDYIQSLAPQEIDFTYLKKNVLDPYCLKCHETEFDTDEHLRVDYNPGSPNNSPLYTLVVEKLMPPKKALDDKKTEMIRNFIQNQKP